MTIQHTLNICTGLEDLKDPDGITNEERSRGVVVSASRRRTRVSLARLAPCTRPFYIMPGPRNSKKKKRAQVQREKEKRCKTTAKDAEDQHIPYQPLRSQPLRYSYDKHILTAQDTQLHILSDEHSTQRQPYLHDSICVYDPQPAEVHELTLPEPTCLPIDPAHLARPCVEDTGDGLHVRDVLAFVFDSRLASPPSLDDALCAELVQDEVLDMLCAVLPEECATVRLIIFVPLLPPET